MGAVSVYVIECGGMVKIGIAADPHKRLRGLNTGSPTAASLVNHRAFDCRKVAHEIESRMHRLLRHHWVRGEWFNVPAADAWTLLKKQRPLRLIDPQARHDSVKRWASDVPHEEIARILTGRA